MNTITALENLTSYVKSTQIEQGVDLSKLEMLVDALRSMPIFNTCRINNYDGHFLPRTLSTEAYQIQPLTDYYYTWVSVDEDSNNDYSDGEGMIMCIYINNGWHQVQSIDFDFNQ